MILKIRKTITILLMPFVKWMGKIKAPFMEKAGLYQCYDIESVLQPGDVILSTVAGHLSNIFNPSKIKHAIAYYGMDDYEGKQVPYIVEAIGAGVTKRPLMHCIGEKDEVVIMRPRTSEFKSNKSSITKFQKFLDSTVGCSYDFKFEVSEKYEIATTELTVHKMECFYCSELVYLALKYVNPNMTFVPRESMGEETVTPLDFFLARDKFELVYKLLKPATEEKLNKLI